MTPNMKRRRLLTAAGILGIVAVGLSTLLLWDKEQTTTQSETLNETACSNEVIQAAQVDGKLPKKESVPAPFLNLVKDAEIICSDTVRFDRSKQQTERVRIYKTSRFKYPIVRAEETVIQDGKGQEKIIRAKAMVADHIMVRKKKGVSFADFEAFCSKSGGKIRKRMPLSGLYLVSFDDYDMNTVQHQLTQFKDNQNFVRNAELDYIVYAVDAPDDSSFSELWGLNNTGQTGGTPDADIDAVEAWDITVGSRNVLVGVIDSGIDYNHPDLAANMWTNPNEIAGNGIDDDGNGFIDDIHGWDFVNGDNDPMDDYYHGTHCAGTIGAVGNNGTGVVGVNWQVSMAAIKFLNYEGSGPISEGIESIRYGTSIGCSLTSNSWATFENSEELKAAIEDANANGVLLIAAAGNYNGDNDEEDEGPQYPASHDCENIIAVAATDHDDSKSSFSNYGRISVDLAAPGTDVLSTLPTSMTAAMEDRGHPTDYGLLSGTSMATPHVSAVCALLKALVPGMTHMEIKKQILSTVDLIPGMDGYCVTGGRLNAYRALEPYDGAFMVLRSLVVDDSVGNGDGFINPGEQIGIDATVANMCPRGADGVTASIELAEVSPHINLVTDTIVVGDVDAETELVLPEMFVIRIGAEQPIPATITVNLIFTDAFSEQWTSSFDLSIDRSSTISGIVQTLATPVTPIAGATISYSGPVSGETMTAADGTYSIPVLDGTYSLVASADDYSPSAPIELAIPPHQYGVDFALGNARIAVTPSSITETMTGGQSVSKIVTIRNDGNVPLDFQVQRAKRVLDEPSLQTAKVSSGLEDQDTSELSKKTVTPAVMPLAESGLEGFDYEWRDSDEIGGPSYVWNDISMSGTQLSLDDDSYDSFDFDFDFPFYENTFTKLYVGSNGYVTFGKGWEKSSSRSLPSTNSPTNLIAGIFSDLDPSNGGQVYAQADSETVIIQFQEVPFYNKSSEYVTFQIVLHKSGSICLYYKKIPTWDDVVNPLSPYTVGVQNAMADKGLQIAHEEDYLKNELAIQIVATPGWIWISEFFGTVPAGGEMQMEVKLNSDDLFAGTYTVDLLFEHNDVSIPGPLVVPVDLTVAGPYVSQIDTWIDDDEVLPSIGDGDDVVEPGETVELQSLVRNDGDVAATSLLATLSTSSPYLVITAPTAVLPDVAPGTTAQLDSAFVVEVLPTCPSGYVAEALITFADDAGHTWTEDVTFEVVWNCTISGQVTDLADGTPIVGATVGIDSLSITTDPSGNYAIRDLPAGRYTVTVEKPGVFISRSQDVTLPPDATLDFVLGAPRLSVIPGSIAETLYTGESATQTVTIHNDGSLPLDFHVDGADGLGAPALGGPDSYGYRWTDSDEPDGPSFVWNDISSTGTRLSISDANRGSSLVDLGESDSSFHFYGNRFTKVYVNVHGYVTLGEQSYAWWYNPLPYKYAPSNLIAGFFESLNPTISGDVYAQVDSDKVTIQYQNVALNNDHWSITFQIVLHKSGSINLYYKEFQERPEPPEESPVPSHYTVGIQNTDGDDGLSIAHNEDYLHSGLAVRIASGPEWLSASPVSGTLAPGSEMDVDVMLNAAGLAPNVYNTMLRVLSNDPQTSNWPVPVVLNVERTAPEIESISANPDIVTLPETTEASVVASDPNGDLLSYQWTLLTGPGTATFSPDDMEVSEVSFDVAGTYVLAVTVSDGTNSTDSEVTVVVQSSQEFPVAGSWYFIENKYRTLARLKHDDTTTPAVVATTDDSIACKWQFIKVGSAWFIQNANGQRLQDGNGGNDPEMVAGTITGVRAQWDIEDSLTADQYLITSRGGNVQPRLRTDDTAVPDMCGGTLTGAFAQWEIVETTAPATPPTVMFSSPSNGDQVLDNQDVIVTVDASDNSGIQKVILWSKEAQDAAYTWHGAVTTTPYEWNLGNLSVGTYTLIAKAIANDAEAVTTEITVNVIPGATEPTIAITSHSEGDQVLDNQDVIVTVDASDDSGIAKLHLWSKEEQAAAYTWHGAVTTTPYEWNLGNLPVGTYTLVAKAIANDAETVTTEITITVIPGATEPTITITSHSEGDQVLDNQDVVVTVDASDDSGVAKLHLWSKEEQAAAYTWHGAVTTDPYEWNLGNLPVGTYTLIAKAIANDAETVTTEITIEVISVSTEPTITIISHADGDQVSASEDVIVTVAASDDSGIARAKLWTKEADATTWSWHGIDTTEPYEWNLGQLPVGTYKLSTKADTNDGVTVTKVITITVVNP